MFVSGRDPSTTGVLFFGVHRENIKNYQMSFCCICFGNRHLIVDIFENSETESVKTLKNDVSKMLIGLKSTLLRNRDFEK